MKYKYTRKEIANKLGKDLEETGYNNREEMIMDLLAKKECNCIMSGKCLTTNYCPIHRSTKKSVYEFSKTQSSKKDKPEEENVPTKVLKLQVFDEAKHSWQDISDFDYPENEAWTETGCYRIALNQFRLIDVTPIPTPKKPEKVSVPEKIDWNGFLTKEDWRQKDELVVGFNNVIDYLLSKEKQ